MNRAESLREIETMRQTALECRTRLNDLANTKNIEDVELARSIAEMFDNAAKWLQDLADLEAIAAQSSRACTCGLDAGQHGPHHRDCPVSHG